MKPKAFLLPKLSNILIAKDQSSPILLLTQIIFYICMIWLYIYLISVRLYSPLPIVIYWMSVVIAILVVVFQVVSLSRFGGEKLILLEVLVLAASLNLIYQIPLYGFADTDSWRHMILADKIIEGADLSAARIAYGKPAVSWPFIQTWAVGLHYITGISTFGIAKWFPSIFIHVVFLLGLYVLAKRVFGDSRIGFLAILTFSLTQMAFQFGTKFHYENLAMVIMMSMLILLTLLSKTRNPGYFSLALLCSIGVILTHHTTSLILLIFLIISLAATYGLTSLRNKFFLGRDAGSAQLYISGVLVILVFVMLFSHWIFVFDFPLRTMVEWFVLFFSDVGGETLAEVGIGLPTTWAFLRGQIIFWGFYFFNVVFALMLLHGSFFRRKDKTTEFYTFVPLFFICAILAFVQVYIHTPTHAPDQFRLMAWAWVFGAAPLVVVILGTKPGLRRKISLLLLVGYLIFNVYQISPALIDPYYPARESGDIALQEDYALARTLTLTDKGAAFHKTRLAIWDTQDFLCAELPYISTDQLETLDWVVVKKKQLVWYLDPQNVQKYYEVTVDPELLDRLVELTDGSSLGRNRVYESRNLILFK